MSAYAVLSNRLITHNHRNDEGTYTTVDIRLDARPAVALGRDLVYTGAATRHIRSPFGIPAR